MVRTRPPCLFIVLALVIALAAPVAAQAQASGGDDILDNLGDAQPKAPSGTTDVDAVEPTKPAPKASEPEEAPKPGAQAASQAAASVDRIKAVPKKALLKRHRIELSPFVSTTLNDSFYQHFAAAGSLTFYPHDSFGIGLGADYMWAHLKSDNFAAVRENLISVPAVFEPPTLFAHVDATWVPLYGKLSLFDSDIINFDFYTVAGLGFALAGSRTPPEANIGIGQRFVMSDWLALKLEVRDHMFLDTQKVGDRLRSDIQNYVMVMLGASLFVPPSFEYGAQ